jgi:DNA repair photolyase
MKNGLANKERDIKVRSCSPRPIIQPCHLEGYAYQVDPYIGCEHYCYYCYALNRAETDWTEEILIYSDLFAQLSRELEGLEPQSIYVGMNSDPYQPVEETKRQTREVLELLNERAYSACILTKSPLVTRDIDLFKEMPEAFVGFSVAFQDEPTRTLFEANAPSNEARIQALRALKEAGVRTYVLICPVMPFITDVEELISEVAPYADTIWVYGLSMHAEEDRNWGNVRGILNQHFPEMTENYRQLVFSKSRPYWINLRKSLEKARLQRGLDLRAEL